MIRHSVGAKVANLDLVLSAFLLSLFTIWCLVPASKAFAAETTASTGGASSAAGSASVMTRRMESFADLRNEVLNAIGGATSRIWLASDFLSDGEIVSALYVAQYRKVGVQVLLGRAKSNSYMSRLNYLKAQNIPVFLKPPSMRRGPATALLTDNSLITVNGELDFLARNRRFDLTVGTVEEAKSFEGEFAAAVQQAIPARAAAMPLVGKAKNEGRYVPQPRTSQAGSTEGSGGIFQDGVYRYGQARQPRPNGVSEKLPRATILQQNGRPHEAQGATTTSVLPTAGAAVGGEDEKRTRGFSETDIGSEPDLPAGINSP